MTEQIKQSHGVSAAQTLFTVRDVARIFGLKESRLRYWAQTGFINPSGRKGGYRTYTFSDLVEIKAAHGLIEAGIPLQRVRRTLKALRQAMPAEQASLTRLRVQSDGDDLVVTEDDATFNPVSGQLLIDFELVEVGQQAAEVLQFAEAAARRSERGETPELRISPLEPLDQVDREGVAAGEDSATAYGWFLRGCALDEQGNQVDEAIAAYRRSIDLDPGLAAAHTNLGNLHYRLEQRSDALRCYEVACSLDPEQAEARYNLANIYEEEGDYDLAIAEYRQALRRAPDFADLHFNLALTLERVGSRVQAIRHWRRYLELGGEEGGEDPWQRIAVEHLARLERADGRRSSEQQGED